MAIKPFEEWYHPEVAAILMKQFKKHMLGLYIALRKDNTSEFRQIIYTGFILNYKNIPFWVSAGHVINNIIEIFEKYKDYENVKSWADDYFIKGAESVPASFERKDIFSTFKKGNDPDFGAIRIPNFDAYALFKNENLMPIDENIWYKHEKATPAGYYIFWYPEDLQEPASVQKSKELKTHILKYSYVCIPVKKIEYDSPEVNKLIFNNPNDFYGKIMLPLGGDGPTSIKGMSGSPIFSIERNEDNLIYRLYGILKSWDKTKSIIRAEHIRKIIDIIGD